MLIFVRFDKYVGFLLLIELDASKLQYGMQVGRNRSLVCNLDQ